jgi:3-oxoacyl-[acyl-carrier-protein] synthase-3
VQLALTRAGLTPDQVGLVLGDCSTPWQTTPAEGQRVAGIVGIKAPAFDLTCSGAPFALHLETLAAWRDERRPDYIVCLSTNTPTQRIDFSRGEERVRFGDGAAAVVVSSRQPGRLALREAHLMTEPLKQDLLRVDAYGLMQIAPSFVDSFVQPRTIDMLRRALRVGAAPSDLTRIRVIPPQIDRRVALAAAQAYDLPVDQFWLNLERYGDSMGAAAMAVLSERWDELSAGDTIVQISAGGGLSCGYLTMECL